MKKIHLVLFALIMVINIYYISQKNHVNYYDHKSELRLYNSDSYILEKNDILEQKIIARENNFNKITIMVFPENLDIETYLEGYITIGLKDTDGNVISEYQYEKIFFNKEYKVTFNFPTQKYSKGKEYFLYIKSFKSSDFSFYIAENANNSELLSINGESDGMSLLLETYYVKGINSLAYIVFAVISFVIFILVFILNKFNFVIEKKYLIIAIILSLLNIFLTPLFYGQDETSHFYRIYEISNGNIVTDEVDDWPGYEVPKSLINIAFGKYVDLEDKFFKVDNKETFVANMEYMAVYSPISYLPQTIGLSIAKLFSDYPIIWAYSARLLQALFCIMCVFCAIKIIPFGKNILFLIAMLPSYLNASSLMSTDGVLVATSMLFIAKILQLIYKKKKVEKNNWIILLILSICVSLAKLVYFPIVGLLLLIPMHLKKVKKRYVFGIIAISLLIMLGWNSIAMGNLVSGQGVNAIYLIKYYFFHPISFIQIFFNTFTNEVGNYVSDLAGADNLWFGSSIKDASIVPQLFMLIYLIFVLKGENKLEKKDKKLVLICMLFTYFLICISLLISCTPPYNDVIVGIQGRYFIPLLLLIYLIFAKEKKNKVAFDFDNVIPLIYLMYFLSYFISYV